MNSDFVTVVSGLPRSGTSLMMQALEAGGMSVLTDNIRKRDEDNPKGYYEYEPVKKTKTDPTWVTNAVGKAVKMVYKLIYDLPEQYEYRVIFTERKMDEVLASQRIMLNRTKQIDTYPSDGKFADLFNRDLEKIYLWLESQKNFSMISINYNKIVKSPITECQRVNEFLGIGLDIDKMASVVNPLLYRNKL
jgi:hypothetical protein